MRCGFINTTIGDVMTIVASWTPASGHAICGGLLSSGPQHEIRFGILLSWLSHPLSRHSIRVCSVRWCRTLALFRSCLTASVKVGVTVPAYWITEGGAALLDHVEPRRHLLWVVSVSFVKCETSQTITSLRSPLGWYRSRRRALSHRCRLGCWAIQPLSY